MRTKFYLTIVLLILAYQLVNAQKKDSAAYVEWKPDEISEKILNERIRGMREREKLTEQIIQNTLMEHTPMEHYSLKADVEKIRFPLNVHEFEFAFHFPPVPQDWAQCCWSYTSTSVYESEMYRKTGKTVKLSEMWSVYYEHIEKVENLIRSRGASYYGEGSQMNALRRIYNKYGIVPYEAYPGKICCTIEDRERRDYVPMYNEITSYIDWIKENNLWDIEENMKHVRLILNKHMGPPPHIVVIDGKEFTPKEYYRQLELDVNEYVDIVSTMRFPFYTYTKFLFRDNWWHNQDYFNVPIGEFYETLKSAVINGFTVGIAADLSQEPGMFYLDKGIAFVPDFDIPAEHINQFSREFRIYNKTTVDDHGMHLVGYTQKDGHDWFLVKETGDPGRESEHRGYLLLRGDYVKLKVLYFYVHRDAVQDLLKMQMDK